MVAFSNEPIDTARVRLTRDEALLIVTAITIGVANGDELPKCCKSGIESFVNRVLDAFGMKFQVNDTNGDLLVDGIVIARLADARP